MATAFRSLIFPFKFSVTILVHANCGDFRSDLENLKKKYGFKEPDRGNLDDPIILWRVGKPDYTKVRKRKFNIAQGWD